ncbi:MAG TPA: lysylphosphatidylglycerol synthase transmembrane domain-containing protein [Candidatus Saccharimonadales bacterium]|jgi:hypothetical protein|nr:lysylphosphatidylglycerol synthase transmembrane domain-containing protein [Candidatus Saccharimonadales bacterium]
MSENSFLKRRWKLIVNILTVIALVVLVVAIRHQLVDTFKNLGKVHAWAILLMIPVQWGNYHAQTKMYQGLFKVVGNKLGYKFLFKASLELNFVNNVFPSGGVSGISYFGMRMRGKDLTAGKATVVQMMKLVLLFLSFEVLLVFGLLFMAIGGHVNNLVILVTTAISTLMVVGTVAFANIIGSEKRINVTFIAVTRVINRFLHFFRRNHPETISMSGVRRAVEELHGNYRLIRNQYRELRWPFWWAIIANATEVLSIYVVYIAFGHWVNVGAVILAYAVANFAGLVSVLPGGVGIYEALMTGVLVTAGVPARLSIPVTVMYRVLNTIIQLPPGYVLYHRSLRRNAAIEEEIRDA